MNKVITAVFFVFIGYTHTSLCMEITKVKKQDPYNPFDLLQNNGQYLKALIKKGTGIHYYEKFSIAQKTLKCALRKSDNHYYYPGVHCANKEQWEVMFGKEAMQLASKVVEQKKIPDSLKHWDNGASLILYLSWPAIALR